MPRRGRDWTATGLLSILGCLLLAGCEDAEAKARYVKAPLESADLTDRTSWSDAVSEARTRLASVRNDRLRTDLSKEIDGAHDRALEQIREIERNEAAARQAERELQAERERAAAALEEERRRAAERKYQDDERRRAAERKRDARPEPPAEESSPTHAAHEQAERRRAALEHHRERAKEAVTDLEVGIRNSLLNDGTKVVVLRNAKPYPVSFDLRCFTRGDTAQKAFSMRIPAGGEKRLGFVQGWCGNFTGGERCEAYVEGEQMWSYTVPED